MQIYIYFKSVIDQGVRNGQLGANVTSTDTDGDGLHDQHDPKPLDPALATVFTPPVVCSAGVIVGVVGVSEQARNPMLWSSSSAVLLRITADKAGQ